MKKKLLIYSYLSIVIVISVIALLFNLLNNTTSDTTEPSLLSYEPQGYDRIVEELIIEDSTMIQSDEQFRKSPFEFIDGHADSITAAMNAGQNLYKNELHLDFERLAEFTSPIQILAIYCADEHLNDPFAYANTAIDFIESELAVHNDIIGLALSLEDMERNALSGKVSVILSLEGGEPLTGNIENVDHFYNRGIRMIGLTWNRENELGYGINIGSEQGLKPFGIDVVKRMNELCMIIDVSHLNEAGFWDVHNLSNKPYIASHSNTYAVTPHQRNLKDEQIKAIADKGGLIGINLYPPFLISSGDADIESIISHINHIISLGAVDFIGLGSDFDGISSMPLGFEDIQSLKMLSKELSERLSEDTSRKIMSHNYYSFFIRFFN